MALTFADGGEDPLRRLRPALPGLLLAVTTLLFGFGLGIVFGLILLVVLLGTRPAVTRAIGLGLGAGALGYSVFWLWAGFRAPGLGSTGAAKESLQWLALPSSGAVVIATAAVAVLCLIAVTGRRQPD